MGGGGAQLNIRGGGSFCLAIFLFHKGDGKLYFSPRTKTVFPPGSGPPLAHDVGFLTLGPKLDRRVDPRGQTPLNNTASAPDRGVQ